MCAVLEISLKIYYKYRNSADPDYYDYLIIKKYLMILKKHIWGCGITDGLFQKYGVIMNRKKVLRIMKKYNIQAEYYNKSKNKT